MLRQSPLSSHSPPPRTLAPQGSGTLCLLGARGAGLHALCIPLGRRTGEGGVVTPEGATRALGGVVFAAVLS